MCIKQTLAERGLFLDAGTIVDAGLIAAPTSTKNQRKARDPEMHSSKKGNQWFFGYKFHIGVDHKTGLAHTLKVTSGHVSHIAEVASLLHGAEQFEHGDADYQCLEKRPEMPTENSRKATMNMPSCYTRLLESWPVAALKSNTYFGILESALASQESLSWFSQKHCPFNVSDSDCKCHSR